jgi:endonuclease/exonuclease/phosphatase family metal-dependent hydrolase
VSTDQVKLLALNTEYSFDYQPKSAPFGVVDMRVLSLNAWGGRLWARLKPFLTDADPDVLCLQEVTNTPDSDLEWLTYRDHSLDLPQRANLLQEVGRAFDAHQAMFCPAARGELWDGARNVPSEWGLATFVRYTYPVIGQIQDFIHGEFSAQGWGEHPRARNAHGVRLFDYAGSFPVTIVHLHGLRELTGKQDTPDRLAQARALTDLIARIRRKSERLVVCGDFNVLPSSDTLQSLMQIGLTDLVTSGGYRDTRTSYYGKPDRFADYMLVSPEVEVRRFDIVKEPEVSDHRALLLDLA